ncbi:M48 family metallopeptidase [Maridesulfovibrio bastinii]|uniref:beta-barrel assembly-enhancing protease n=1 Tax=Maridesulfovibrio bastinii TaxID=47157 RepID=UPI0004229277|nr:M48 family metallopeptidase [Maridesulfovibrio bastinii]
MILKIKNKSVLISFILIVFFSVSTLSVDVSANSFFGKFTVKDEIELGTKFDKMLHERMHFVTDPEITEYVKGVVKKVADKMPPQPFPIKAAVIRNPSMNAFAVPGGYIYIFTGLLLDLKHEDELAAVIGHELAHVALRHVAERMEKMQLVSMASMLGTLAGMVLGIAGGGGNTGNLGKALAYGSMAGGQAAYLSYTQENERQADHLGMNFLVSAGYNPEAMIHSFKIMKRRQWYVSNNNIPSYLATHPGLDTRIDYLKDRVMRMPPEYLKRQTDNSGFRKVQTLLRARMTDPKVALAYYNDIPEDQRNCLDSLGLGIIYSRMKRIDEATAAFEEALKGCGSDPIVLREAGIFFFQNGKADKAWPLLQEAYIRNPKDAVALFFMARIDAQRKNYDKAIATMRMVNEKVPGDSEVLYHLGRILGESGNYFEAHLQLAYSALYKGDRNQRDFHLKKAEGLAKTAEQKAMLAKLEKKIRPPEKEEKKPEE